MAKKEANICISTNIFEHPLWRSDKLSRFEAWLCMVKEAQIEDSKVFAGTQTIEVKRGQLYVTQESLAASFGWSIKKVRNFLDMLEDGKIIEKGRQKGRQKTLITICNFDDYIFDGKKRAVKRADKGQTENEEKETPLSNDPKYIKFMEWIKRKAPYCFKNMDMPTEEEFLKLKEKYTGTEISETISQIENRKDLRKRYKSLYRTILNWAKKEYGVPTTT